MRVIRAFEHKREPTAFTGEGARLYGGRWNSVGVPVVYTASSFALALLELMVNARSGHIPPGLVYATVDIPEEIVIAALDVADLPENWFVAPAPPQCQAAGDSWIRRNDSVALVVPSAVARVESNVLLNPNHADFIRVTIGATQDLAIDPRLRR